MRPKPVKMTTINGDWIEEMVHTVGQYIRFETLDGGLREGQLTKINCKNLKWNGRDVLIPTELELNDDPQDSTPLHRLSWIHVVSVED